MTCALSPQAHAPWAPRLLTYLLTTSSHTSRLSARTTDCVIVRAALACASTVGWVARARRGYARARATGSARACVSSRRGPTRSRSRTNPRTAAIRARRCESHHSECIVPTDSNFLSPPKRSDRWVGGGRVQDTSTWDTDLSITCHCDSAWPVGLRAGETQVSEWFDSACSAREYARV